MGSNPSLLKYIHKGLSPDKQLVTPDSSAYRCDKHCLHATCELMSVMESPDKQINEREEYDFLSCSSSPLQMGSKLLRYTSSGGHGQLALPQRSNAHGGNLITLQLC